MKPLIKIILICTLSLHINAKELTLIIYPYKENKVLYEENKAILDYLEKTLQVKIDFKISKDYNNLIELLTSNQADLAIIAPYNYIKAKKTDPNIQYLVTKQILHNNKVSSSYRGMIVTKKESGITHIKELKNKTFGYTDFNSSTGYLLPRFILKTNQILTKDLKKVYMLKKHPRVMEALYRNSIDAGATYDENYEVFKEKYGDIFNLLYTSKAIPNNAIIASSYLSKPLKEKIENALLNFKVKKGTHHFNGFIKKEESIYDYVKETAKAIQ